VHRRARRSTGGAPRYWRALALAAVVVCATGSGTAAPEEGPLPPCRGVLHPASPDLGAPPQVQVWNPGELPAPWRPPACTGSTTRDFKMLIALAGSFRHDGDAEALLGRFGAVSTLTEMRYWSVSDSAWRPLVTEATALSAPGPDSTLIDSTPTPGQASPSGSWSRLTCHPTRSRSSPCLFSQVPLSERADRPLRGGGRPGDLRAIDLFRLTLRRAERPLRRKRPWRAPVAPVLINFLAESRERTVDPRFGSASIRARPEFGAASL
jgi:hypothetical protein